MIEFGILILCVTLSCYVVYCIAEDRSLIDISVEQNTTINEAVDNDEEGEDWKR